eukprot:scaffold5222_cov293-Pinguiococcus_pyrenoidosus.AAC.7
MQKKFFEGILSVRAVCSTYSALVAVVEVIVVAVLGVVPVDEERICAQKAWHERTSCNPPRSYPPQGLGGSAPALAGSQVSLNRRQNGKDAQAASSWTG